MSDPASPLSLDYFRRGVPFGWQSRAYLLSLNHFRRGVPLKGLFIAAQAAPSQVVTWHMAGG